MTAYTAPRTALQFTPAPSTDQGHFVRFIYQDGSGYAEIVAGQSRAKDPSKIDLVMSTRRWLYIDPLRPDLDQALLDYADTLRQQYGNVYISVRLYTRQAKADNTRKEAYTLPSRVIFIDDAPADPTLPYSAFVQTSATSGHGYYLADQKVSKPLGKRAAAALGGDPSGYDLTQLVRLPDTRNTKNNGAFRVTLRTLSSRTYRTADLCAAFPEVQVRATNDGEPITPIAWPDAEKALGNIKRHIGRIKATMKEDCHTRRILGPKLDGNGEMISYLVNGKPDASRSMNRCAVAHGLLLAGLLDHEIAAVLYKCCNWGHSAQKGSTWLQSDIERCITDAHAAFPNARERQNATRGAEEKPAAPIEHIEPPRRGRPQALPQGAATYVRWLLDSATSDNKILGTRAENAAQLKTSVATIARWERTTRDADVLTRHTTKSRRDSWIQIDTIAAAAFLGRIKNTSQATQKAQNEVVSSAPLSRIATLDPEAAVNGGYTPPRETAPASDAGVVLSPMGAAVEHTTGGECIPPRAQPEPLTLSASVLRELIRASFDRWQAKELIDQSTGELRRGSVRLRSVEADLFAAGFGLVEPKGIEKLFKAEQKCRRDAHRKEQQPFQIARLERKVREMRLSQLKRKARSLAGMSHDYEKQGKRKQAYVFRLQAGIYEAEIIRRTDIAHEDAEINKEIARVAGPPVVPTLDGCDVALDAMYARQVVAHNRAAWVRDYPLPAAVTHARKLIATRCAAWERNADNLTWWECAHDDDLPFSAMEFRAAALAEMGKVTNAA